MTLVLLILLINFILLLFLLFKVISFNKRSALSNLMTATIIFMALQTICEFEIVRASESYIQFLYKAYISLTILVIFFSANSIWALRIYYNRKRGKKSYNFGIYFYSITTVALLIALFWSAEAAYDIHKINGVWTYEVIYSHPFNIFIGAWLFGSISLLIYFVYEAYLKTSTKTKKRWMRRYLLAIGLLPPAMFFFFFLSTETPKYFFLSPLMMICALAWILVNSNFKLFKTSPHGALNEILKTIPSIILILDAKYRISYINLEGQRALGMKKNSFKKKSIFTLARYLKIDFYSLSELESIEQDTSLDKEVAYQSEFFYNMKVKPIFNKRQLKTGYLIVGHDISSFKQEERERIAAYELLKHSNKELERFAYIASHDLKTPLRNIISFVGLMDRALKKGNTEPLPEYMNYLKMYSNNMFQIVQDVLEMSRINDQYLAFEDVEMDKVINRVKMNLEVKLQKLNAQILISPLPTIRANESQILQVVQNLIENGLKYNTNYRPTIWIDSNECEGFQEFTIRDNGIGISQEYHEQVFEMFKRLHSIDKYEGSGIGLALCKKIIEAHSGTISIESPIEGEEGTKVIFRIPKLGNSNQQKKIIDKPDFITLPIS